MGKKKKPKGVWSDRRRWLMHFVSAVVVVALGKVWDAFWLPVAAPTSSGVPSKPAVANPPMASQSSSTATASVSNLRVAAESVSLGESLGIRVIRKPSP
jgi:hypothetical protein